MRDSYHNTKQILSECSVNKCGFSALLLVSSADHVLPKKHNTFLVKQLSRGKNLELIEIYHECFDPYSFPCCSLQSFYTLHYCGLLDIKPFWLNIKYHMITIIDFKIVPCIILSIIQPIVNIMFRIFQKFVCKFSCWEGKASDFLHQFFGRESYGMSTKLKWACFLLWNTASIHTKFPIQKESPKMMKIIKYIHLLFLLTMIKWKWAREKALLCQWPFQIINRGLTLVTRCKMNHHAEVECFLKKI